MDEIQTITYKGKSQNWYVTYAWIRGKDVKVKIIYTPKEYYEEVLSLWQQVDIFDWDNLELGEWEGFSLMFPDDEIYKMVQQQFRLIELFTCRLLPNGKSLA